MDTDFCLVILDACISAEDDHKLLKAMRKARITPILILSSQSCHVERLKVLGVDLSTIQSIVGHADVNMTQHYLHVQEGIRQEAIRKFAQAFPIDGHSLEGPDGAACRVLPFPQVV